jgi:hypothetical protein
LTLLEPRRKTSEEETKESAKQSLKKKLKMKESARIHGILFFSRNKTASTGLSDAKPSAGRRDKRVSLNLSEGTVRSIVFTADRPTYIVLL